jgi:Rps23 Pro-64 3,4-dihydroxylase Tpa1-like proline 4-hydroxylase
MLGHGMNLRTRLVNASKAAVSAGLKTLLAPTGMEPAPVTAFTPFRLPSGREWMRLADAHREAFAKAEPFPHIQFDGLFDPRLLDQVVAEFPPPESSLWRRYDAKNEAKLETQSELAFGPAARAVTQHLNAGAFVAFLESLTGIEGLVPDPVLMGGGMHRIERGGYLGVHADFNRHWRLKLYRRLNVLLYLNRGWHDDWGGHLELWDRGGQGCVTKIAPLFNRLVIFCTDSTSFHGHPHPLACPEGRARMSLASYYYSADRPGDETREPHSTIWV